MKKRILLFILAVAMPVGSIFAQMSYNHWSIQAKGGINTIRGLYKSVWDRDYNPEYGGAIEYSLSPVIGIGVEYLYQNNDHSSAQFTSNIHQTTFFTSLNLSNLALQYRKGGWNKLNTYLTVGAGFGYGDWAETTTSRSGDILNLAGSIGLNLEYNIIPALAIGIEPQYRWNSNGKYNPNTPVDYQNTKDFYTINLNLRYKIGSKMHIRNQSYANYQFDEISNSENQKRKDAATRATMEQLIDEHAMEQDVLVDSLYKETLKADSAIIKQLNDYKDSMKLVQNTLPVSTLPNKPVVTVNERTQRIPLVEPIVEVPVENVGVSTKPVSMRKESYANTPYCNSLLKEFSVVVGSFSSKENANRLSNKLKNEGFANTVVVQNDQGMYRVIPFTSNNVDESVAETKKMRSKYPDAWITICVMKK